MSEKISVKLVDGNREVDTESLESCETLDQLEDQLLDLAWQVEIPSVIYQDSDGEIWRLRIRKTVEKEKPEPCTFDAPLPLTKKLAEEFLADPERELAYYTSMETDSAEILAEHPGDLELKSLSNLSEGAAETLSKHKGGCISLGLSELSENVATALSKHKGEGLSLDVLSELSKDAAASLSKHKGKLKLDGLYELSDGAAEALSKHNGSLSLHSLYEPSEGVVEALSKHKGPICGMDPAEWSAEFKPR